jgi:hypothetical protein
MFFSFFLLIQNIVREKAMKNKTKFVDLFPKSWASMIEGNCMDTFLYVLCERKRRRKGK